VFFISLGISAIAIVETIEDSNVHCCCNCLLTFLWIRI
jgi:hypothetical protein